MPRVLAHYISYEGRRYTMAIAEFTDDFSSVSITPFRGETANTLFVEGEIEVKKLSSGFSVEKNGRKLVF